MNTPTSQFEAKNLANEAADAIDRAGSDTAESLHAAASSIRKAGHRGSKAIEDFTAGTANTLDDAGTYVKNHDLKRTLSDSRKLVRRFPAESLAVAAGVGFLTGIAILRLTHTCDRS